MRISKDEYDIRTLAYYQAKGGVYNELITVLTLLRNDPKNRGMAMPAKVLNEACYQYDFMRAMFNDNDIKAHIEQYQDTLILCAVSALATMLDDTGILITHAIEPYIKKDTQYYPYFKTLIKRGEEYNLQIFEELHSPIKEDQIDELKQNLKTIEEQLKATEEQLIEVQEKSIQKDKIIENIKNANPKAVDKNLTFDGILTYIKTKKQYQYTNQIINMLKDKLARVATNEEWEKLLAVEQEIMDQTVQEIHNHNDIKNSNVFTGLINDPQFPIGVDPQEFIEKAVAKYLSEINQQS